MAKFETEGWVAVDLDGTLAHWEGWSGNIGKPIPKMIALVKDLLSKGKQVKIMTARIWPIGTNDWNDPRVQDLREDESSAWTQLEKVQQWCLTNIGQVLPVTCVKDPFMQVLYDDRAIQVERNTGKLIGA